MKPLATAAIPLACPPRQAFLTRNAEVRRLVELAETRLGLLLLTFDAANERDGEPDSTQEIDVDLEPDSEAG